MTTAQEPPLNITPDASVEPLFPDSPQGLSDELAATKARLAEVEEELENLRTDYEWLDEDYDDIEKEYSEYVEEQTNKEWPTTTSSIPQQVETPKSGLLQVEIVKENQNWASLLISVAILFGLNWYLDNHLHLSRQDQFYSWGTVAAMIYYLRSNARS